MTGPTVKPSVLCVDDEIGVVRSLRWLLQEEFHVETACSASEGLALLADQTFHVVISDQRMPGMTGTEFLAQVRQLQPQAMRLLLTGYSDYQAVLDSINKSETYRFINKPWDNAELLHIVSEAASISLSTQAPVPSEGNPTGARDGTVLLLDEDPAVLPLVKGIVGRTSQVLWVRTVHEAAEILAERPVAVVVCEASVRGESTLSLLNALKSQSPEVMVIVQTGERDARTVRRLINEGQVFRFVTKPAVAAHLAVMLHRALARHWDLVAHPPQKRRFSVDPLSPSAEVAMPIIDASWQPYPERMRRRYAGNSE
jgi:DNA-binding NtrC family response regulator